MANPLYRLPHQSPPLSQKISIAKRNAIALLQQKRRKNRVAGDPSSRPGERTQDTTSEP